MSNGGGSLVLLVSPLVCYPSLVSFQLIFYAKFLFWLSLGDDLFFVGSFFLGSGRILIELESIGELIRLRPVDIL